MDLSNSFRTFSSMTSPLSVGFAKADLLLLFRTVVSAAWVTKRTFPSEQRCNPKFWRSRLATVVRKRKKKKMSFSAEQKNAVQWRATIYQLCYLMSEKVFCQYTELKLASWLLGRARLFDHLAAGAVPPVGAEGTETKYFFSRHTQAAWTQRSHATHTHTHTGLPGSYQGRCC